MLVLAERDTWRPRWVCRVVIHVGSSSARGSTFDLHALHALIWVGLMTPTLWIISVGGNPAFLPALTMRGLQGAGEVKRAS